MPALDDLLSGISPETGYPDDFHDLVLGAAGNDSAAANAKIAELQTQLDAALAELQTQKVINYDLMAEAASNLNAGEAIEQPDDGGGDEPDPEDITTDDLFKED